MGILRKGGTEHAREEEPRGGVGRGPRREEEEDRAIATVIATSSSAEYIIH